MVVEGRVGTPEGIKRSSSEGRTPASEGKAKKDNAAGGGVSSVVVAVRVRPLPADSTQSPCISCGATSLTLSPGKSETRFNFDLVFGEDATQEAVYAEVGAPILRKALQGFNATIFAYGQTGSGKTHTMMGEAEEPGVVPRMASELFFCVDKALEASPDTKFLLTCSYLEIYNEVLHDLLQPPPKKGEPRQVLEVGEHPTLGVHVKGLLERPVRCETDVLSLLAAGSHRRATAATLMNDRSSRSHSIFVVWMQRQEAVPAAAGSTSSQRREISARINLVDLAGSERMAKSGARGETMKEGININQSLSALGSVIIALAEAARKNRPQFVPYRNSKLTRVLQESLGARTLAP